MDSMKAPVFNPLFPGALPAPMADGTLPTTRPVQAEPIRLKKGNPVPYPQVIVTMGEYGFQAEGPDGETSEYVYYRDAVLGVPSMLTIGSHAYAVTVDDPEDDATVLVGRVRYLPQEKVTVISADLDGEMDPDDPQNPDNANFMLALPEVMPVPIVVVDMTLQDAPAGEPDPATATEQTKQDQGEN